MNENLDNFDWNYYLENNKDLYSNGINSKEDAVNHWIKYGKNENRKDVLFIDASKDFISGKNQNSITDEHLNKILDCYKKRSENPKYSKLATLSEIKENDFNLNIPRYIDTFEEEVEIDIKAVEEEIKTLESELLKVRGEMSEILKELEI